MKKIFLLFTWGILSVPLFSQVYYGYDLAGNRISRSLTLSATAAFLDEGEFYSERVEDLIVKIYPNPTAGRLKVEILNLGEKETARVSIYDSFGKLQVEKKNVKDEADFDLSSHPTGTYHLKIIAGERFTEWTIIKI